MLYCTYGLAKFTELLTGLLCDEAETEHRTVRVGLRVIMAPFQFLHLVWFDVSPAHEIIDNFRCSLMLRPATIYNNKTRMSSKVQNNTSGIYIIKLPIGETIQKSSIALIQFCFIKKNVSWMHKTNLMCQHQKIFKNL